MSEVKQTIPGVEFPVLVGASLSEPHTSEKFRRVNHVRR